MEVHDPVLAKSPSTCCLKSSIHEGEPRGCFSVVSGIETYISKPMESRSNGHVLLYFPDVWGLFKNGLLVMDGFSDAGYLVLGLDYFRGDPVWKHRKNRHDTTNADFDYEAWKEKHTKFANTVVPRWVKEVKRMYSTSDTKYVAVGYCFGAPYVCDELAGDIITAGAFGHPAFLREHHFSNLKSKARASRSRALEILREKEKIYQLQLFSGVEHGFSLRGDMNNPYERYVKEQSFKAIVEWLDFWVKY